MTNLQIPHNAWVLIGDGRRALVLRNDGNAKSPNLLAVIDFKEAASLPTSELGTDVPGRAIERLTGRRSAVKQTDWHDIAEHKFVQTIASTLSAADREGDISALVVVAPPRTLAELRNSLTDSLKSKIIAEVNKDLTKHPIHEIGRLLTGAPQN